MSTHDYNLANQSGASFRSDLNNALAAILSNNSNGSAPSTTVAYSIWADTTAGKLKIRNSANDAFIDLINLDGTIARDLTLTGAAANILFDTSQNAIEFADDAELTFGTGRDLIIKHDGANSTINDTGTGNLILQRGGSNVLELTSTGIKITDPGSTAEVEIVGFEASNANVKLVCDEGDDNGDTWMLQSNASNNNFRILNDTSGSDSVLWSMSTAGDVDMTGDLTLSDTHKFIANSSSSGDYIRVYAGTGTGKWDIYGNNANLRIGDNDSAGSVIIDTKLGIGTTNPTVLLDLESTAPTIKLTDSDATGTPECEIRGGGGDLVLAADKDSEKDSSLIKFEIDGNTDMTLNHDGGLTIEGSLNVQNSAGTSYNSAGVIQVPVTGSSVGAWCSRSGTTSTRKHMRFENPNNTVGSISTSGSATSFTESSDYRLKENVVAISDGITRLKTLKPSRFNWKVDETNTLVDGFLAHEVSPAIPEAVIGTKDEVVTQAMVDAGDYDSSKLNNPIYQEIDKSKIVPLLTAALQEAIAKIETLETKVATLEAA